MKANNSYAFSTRAVHAGEQHAIDPGLPVVSPIHQSVSYLSESMVDLDAIMAGEKDGFVYHRHGNPTVRAFEIALADLEQGEDALAFSSGMAAIHAALLTSGLKPGASVVTATDIYGATFALLNRLFVEMGATVYPVDITDLALVAKTVELSKPVALFVETISNPLVKIANIPRLAEIAHRTGAELLVDNTFASPWLYNPLLDGADMVIHSATKSICGHGDVMAGIVVTSSKKWPKLLEITKLVGGVLGPFEAWLGLRGLKTLPLRMREQCKSAMSVAQWLSATSAVSNVFYPGLGDHPQHELASRLFDGRGFGGVLSFEIEGANRETIFRFMESLQLCLPATSLGDVHTLLLHPSTTSHRGLSVQERNEVGIGEGLLRISVGIEDVKDIIGDLEQAFSAIGNVE